MHFLQPSLSSATSRVSFPRQTQSLQVFTDGLRPILPWSCHFHPRSQLVHHLFCSSILVHPGHMTQPRQSPPSDDAAQLLSCSFSDFLVWYFTLPRDMQDPFQPSGIMVFQTP